MKDFDEIFKKIVLAKPAKAKELILKFRPIETLWAFEYKEVKSILLYRLVESKTSPYFGVVRFDGVMVGFPDRPDAEWLLEETKTKPDPFKGFHTNEFNPEFWQFINNIP